MKKNTLMAFTMILGFICTIVITVAIPVFHKDPFFIFSGAFLLVAALAQKKHERDRKKFLIIGIGGFIAGLLVLFMPS